MYVGLLLFFLAFAVQTLWVRIKIIEKTFKPFNPGSITLTPYNISKYLPRADNRTGVHRYNQKIFKYLSSYSI
jgi:hypothetical protein